MEIGTRTEILSAMNEFANHLTGNLGKTINLSTFGAFATMMLRIVNALNED